jgi:hypothetical protein
MEITVPGKQHTHLYVSHKTLHLLYKYCTNVLGDAIVYRLIFSFPAKKKTSGKDTHYTLPYPHATSEVTRLKKEP